ncbi:hypothetical protein IJG20_01720 [Candidatus Saccharibacteria bacterium]|nr:hypothetical protein [Candidatus Saccharibacteria bacterium]
MDKKKVVANKEIVNWDAKEYIQTEKNAWWYVGLVVVTILLGALSIYLKWWTFTALIVLSAVALVMYSVRPPRVLHYSLTNKGLSEGNRLYSYEEYKSFGVYQDGKHYAIMLTPRKRFSPRVAVYFPKESGEKIVDAFGARLPMEEVKLDFLDKLVKFLRI